MPTFWIFLWERAAPKVDYPNGPGGGTGGFSPGRKRTKKTANKREDDLESQSSGSPSNSYGFVAYSVNSAEKSRIKITTLCLQPANSCTSGSDPDRPASPFPGPSPSPPKLRCLDQRESNADYSLEPLSKKIKAEESDPNGSVRSLLWLR